MRIGGAVAVWDTALWSNPAPAAPYNATWDVPAQVSDLATKLLTDPTAGEGALVAPSALGGLRFVVEILNPTLGIDSVWGTALWDSGTWSASVGQWQDISSRVRGLTWTNGQTAPSERASVGVATITLNNRDGQVSPWLTTGAFKDFGSQSIMRAGLIVRFGVLKTSSADDATAPLAALTAFNPFFTGKVESLQESTSENVDGWLDLTLIELTSDLAPVPSDQAVVNGQTVSQTMLASLLASGWTAQTWLDLPDADALVPAATMTNLSAMERLQLLADGLHWDVVADGRGQATIVNRRVSAGVHQGTGSDGSSGLTFSNAPAGLDVPMVSAQPYSSNERVITQATASTPTGPAETSLSLAAATQFGLITNRYGFPRSDLLLQQDADVVALVQHVTNLRAFDDLGIATVSLDADMDTRLFAVLTYIAAYARQVISWQVRWKHPSGASFNETVVIEGQTHSVTMEGSQLKWLATLATGQSGSL